MKKTDNLDIKILNELQKNARISNAEVGRRIGLSAPAIAERIQKMEDEGIIKGYFPLLDYDKLGLSVRVFISFRSKNIKHTDFNRMIELLPEVLEWYTITGDNCCLLSVAVQTTHHLESLIERLQEFGDTTTSIILSNSSSAKINLNDRLSMKNNAHEIKSHSSNGHSNFKTS